MKFQEVLQELHIEYREAGEHHHSRDGWLQLDCPFCGKGTGKFHLGYNLAHNYLSCWRCGQHRVVDTLVEYTGNSASKCAKLLQGLETERPVRALVKRGVLVLPPGVGSLHRAHKEYLRSRGYNVKQLLRLWNIQGIGITPPFQWRIFIPVIHHTEILSWTTRTIGNDPQRYRTAEAGQEAYPAKKLLYGEDYCRHSIIINEGPFDVWRIGPGAVATLGISYSRKQLLRMSKYPIRVVCFDNEPAAQKRARRLCDELEMFPGETYNVVLSGKDASETTDRDIRILRKEFLE